MSCQHDFVMGFTDMYGRNLGRECLDCGAKLAPEQAEAVKTEQDALFSVESIPMVDGQQTL